MPFRLLGKNRAVASRARRKDSTDSPSDAIFIRVSFPSPFAFHGNRRCASDRLPAQRAISASSTRCNDHNYQRGGRPRPIVIISRVLGNNRRTSFEWRTSRRFLEGRFAGNNLRAARLFIERARARAPEHVRCRMRFVSREN